MLEGFLVLSWFCGVAISIISSFCNHLAMTVIAGCVILTTFLVLCVRLCLSVHLCVFLLVPHVNL